MRHNTSVLAIELAWLLSSWAFSYLATGYLLHRPMLWHGPVEIQMHNTYFILTTAWATAPLFLMLVSVVTGIRSLVSRFRYAPTNLALGMLAVSWLLIFLVILASLRR
jgi:hypothetical protein